MNNQKSNEKSNMISYNSLIKNRLKLCLTTIALHNSKKDFYRFYNEILFMFKL